MAVAEIDEGRKAGGSVAALAVVVLVLTAIAAGGGWWLSTILPIGAGTTYSVAKPDAAPHEMPASALANAGQVVKLQPVLVALAAPANVWVRAETSLVAAPGATITPDVAAAVEGDFAAYLAALSLPQLAGASGLEYLREDLEERARLRSNGKVEHVVISSLVME
jgi:flagellar protein FliL